MTRIRYLLPAFLVPAAIGAALAVDGPSPSLATSPTGGAAMTCEIRITDTALGVAVEPVAFSPAHSLHGEYEFTVSKRGGGGTSVSSQGGEFAVIAGEPTILGSAIFDGNGAIKAELTVRWPGGEVSCERRYPAV